MELQINPFWNLLEISQIFWKYKIEIQKFKFEFLKQKLFPPQQY